MVLPAVCLAGIEPEPLLLPLKPDLGGDCRQVPLEDHQALHGDPCVLLSSGESEVLHENCNSLAGKSL
jgi:hypothetical protein